MREWAPADGWPKCFCGACGSALWSRHPDATTIERPPRHVRRRPGHPAAVAPVRRLRRAVGADPGRRAAALPRREDGLMAKSRLKGRRRQKTPAVLRERVAELERERELLNAIANYAPSLICLVDGDGRVRPFAIEPGLRADARLRAARDRRRRSSGSSTSRTASAAAARDCILSAIRSRAPERVRGALAAARRHARSTSPGRARRCRRSRAARST